VTAGGFGSWAVGGGRSVGGLWKSESKKRALKLMDGTGRVSATRATALSGEQEGRFSLKRGSKLLPLKVGLKFRCNYFLLPRKENAKPIPYVRYKIT